jgi:hypothetical protein
MIGVNCADGAEREVLSRCEASKIIEWPHIRKDTMRRVRVGRLNAAKNLAPGNCALFTTVRAAWNAISVPAQAGEPTC